MAVPIPITVFTGFLGSGKTSIILSLLPQLPKDYKVVLLKNEFGDIEVDSKLAKQSSLAAVSEILNGCMCCVLVGQMQNALLEIRDKYRPDRIIIECSGSAFPATLAFQIRELERQTQGDFKLDAIVTVVDAENFAGYEDISPTAKMQASYTDIILINKWELVDERALDTVLDHLHTLNDLTPKIRCQGRNGVDPNLIFGLESKLFLEPGQQVPSHNDEVETISLYTGYVPRAHESHDHHHSGSHTPGEVVEPPHSIDEEVLTDALAALSKETIWRVKGFVRLTGKGMYILNWAFERFELTALGDDSTETGTVRLTVMGERGEVRRAIAKFRAAVHARLE
ncbi:cobW-domain-containing protein [Mycena rosella]|uniref:CobW-domain-containing protein n=1 Tax=Mycena rosella TaxID=1033263 RepID=A0AAD7D1A8_MYCRO|nr:cobW-domain-containing protein [Mycena rosella]